jgi:two-component system, chemotaxis family, sensor kinase CheA
MTDPIDTDLLNIFRDEVGEYLETLNAMLMQIETADSADAEALRELNRVAHSMKGASRAVSLKEVETIAHYMEEVFASAINGSLRLTPDVCDLLYDGLDLIQHVVGGDENNPEALAQVLVELEQVVLGSVPEADDPPSDPSENGHSAPETPPVTPDSPRSVVETPVPAESPKETTSTLLIRGAEESIRVPVGKLDRLMAEVSELLVARMQSEERLAEVQDLRWLHAKWRREWQSVRAAYIRVARRLLDTEDAITEDMATLFKFLENNQRHLTNANQQLSQLVQMLGQDNLRLTTLSDQLQDDVSGMRMVAFETLVGGFQRIVRDLARDTNKLVHFAVEGMAVEVDKTVLDALKDPIMHLLRNAIDHGIETPDQRQQHDKPPTGRVTLHVEQRGNEIVVSVSDDGQGIDVDKIRRKAVNVGLMSVSDADMMSEDDLRSLIFHPGLTTSEQVTAISGRGIGMDVVRDRVESLRGRVSVQSAMHSGTHVYLNVPVSLTRIRCVLLEIGEETYAIPSAVIVRMMTLRRDEVFTAENRDMIVLDDHPVPLVSMSDVLGIPGTEQSGSEFTLLAVRAVDRTVAFEVDGLHSERELVLKPLGPEIARAHYVSGAALLGTGEVVIVLDANDLVRSATGRKLSTSRILAAPSEIKERQLRVLVVDDSITTRTLEKNILETAGFDVSVAIDGAEAWQRINEEAFDVVISDVEMPRMNGLELVGRIKSNPQTRHLPVILLTSLAKPEQKEAGLKAGADAYVVKSSFDQGELLQLIKRVI